MKRDFSLFLGRMTIDRAAIDDALAFAAAQIAPTDRLEDIMGAISHFVTDRGTGPRLPDSHSAALDALTAAGSGFYALLTFFYPSDNRGHAAYSAAQSWVAGRLLEASSALSTHLMTSYPLALQTDTVHLWREQVVKAGVEIPAGTWAGWLMAAQLLDALPYLEDGLAEGLICGMLDGLRQPLPVSLA
ncbi:hypothetical protein [Deinococcus gobiensis]|uniref:Uncharacterized protein n=1 Tax=Deinococcus gobiensis (strain DSM 21396 / JCM 16679 / CGMCC 1.7299 / I-0) TaxID=745776 RepID=H8GX80_DEIGI|nr:hypothetical protein [Deinococcus gobiensis]AFD25809.1 hypothetical protein DGo_CA1882 [Deinococcus gobiensis I-0]